jgi:hypothetical protein
MHYDRGKIFNLEYSNVSSKEFETKLVIILTFLLHQKLLIVGLNCYYLKNRDNHLRINLMLMIFCIPI